MLHQSACNDAVLLVSLLYYSVDVVLEWESFNTCCRPVHHWLLASFLSISGFRLTHLLGFWRRLLANAIASSQDLAHNEGIHLIEFLLDLRQKGTMSQLLLRFSWGVAMPFLALWVVLGASWFMTVSRETPQCVPSETYLWFGAIFLVVCFCWVLFLAALGIKALLLERGVCRAESQLRELENDDVLRRWGPVSHISSHRALEHDMAPVGEGGLSPAVIKALPCEVEKAVDGRLMAVEAHVECSICLEEVAPGDRLRRLPRCGHAFHCACIDLWLVRRADCPLCKQPVIATVQEV